MSVAVPVARVEILRDVLLVDDDFQEGWTVNQGTLTTDGEICILKIMNPYSWATMDKACSFNSATYKYATIRCIQLTGIQWEFKVRKASDQTWVTIATFSDTGTKTIDVSAVYSGEVDMIGLAVNGSADEHVDFDYVVISAKTVLMPTEELDVLDIRVHLGMLDEISSFSLTLQNFNAKYTGQIGVGDQVKIRIGREGSEMPKIFTGRIEEIEFDATPTKNYMVLRGRDKGEELFRLTVTKTYENVKGEDVVVDLIENFTKLKHVRGSTELIEETDTTYTLLEYENTPVFDVLKYVAKSSEKNGVVGFDFRIAPDGKFEFFPRNSKTSPVSLSECIQVARYRKDIHRIRNRIVVYGAAEKAYPNDRDSWTEDVTCSEGSWSSGTGTGNVSQDTSEKIVGIASVKHTTTTPDYYATALFTLNNSKEVNCNKYPSLTFQVKLESSFSGALTVFLEDSSGMWVKKELTIQPNNEWHLQSFNVGSKNSDQWTHNPLNEQPFNWTSIKKIRFDADFTNSNTGSFWIDNLFFNRRRWESMREDASSQNTYGLRELVKVNEELHSDNECARQAEALLNFLKAPAKYLTLQSQVIDYSSNALLPGDKIHVTIPNENIDADYRILSVEYHAIAQQQVLEITLELGKEPLMLSTVVSNLHAQAQSLARCKTGLQGVAGTAGGGGGMEQHGNEWHDPDMTLKSDFDSHVSSKNVHHREWGWADEQGWTRTIALPYCKSNGWIKYTGNPVIAKSGSGWRENGVQHPCVIRRLVDDYKYWCFFTGLPAGETWQSKSIGVLKSNDLISWSEAGISNPLIEVEAGTWKALRVINPAVIYDRWESDENKRWKMWFIGSNSTSGDENNKIGYATAPAPYGPWTEHPDNPVYTPPSDITWGLSVFRFQRLFYMVYALAGGSALKVATSSDGITWYEWGTILNGSSGWETSVRYCSLFWNLGVWYLAYTGGDAASPTYMRIGLATSYSGFRTFDRFPFNPVIDLGTSGSWDDKWVWNPCMIMEESAFKMLYNGRKASTGERAIGYAYLPHYTT